MRLAAALLCVLVLVVAPSARAQQAGDGTAPLTGSPLTAQLPEGEGGLVPVPPVEDDGDGGGGGSGDEDPGDEGPGSPGPAGTGRLPETGAETWWMALIGTGLLLSGAGLRLRTADDRF